MKYLKIALLLFCFSAHANEVKVITQAVMEDIEIFSKTFHSEEIKILEANSRISFNPLQWLLMVKDLAAGESRKVLTFKYKALGAEEIKYGFAVITYEVSEYEDEKCFRISINKLVYDTGIVNLSGIFPGFKTIRIVEKCETES